MAKNENDQVFTINENLEDNPLIEKLRLQRLEGTNTDINLNVQGKIFKCHRSTLTTASPFFEAKLKTSKSKNEIEIDWTDVDSFETILEYIYSGKISLTKENIDKLLALSYFLSINKLKGYCEKYLETIIDLSNCLKIKELSENYKLTKVSELCLNFIHDNLMVILNCPEILELSFKNLELFFTDPGTGCDNIPLTQLLSTLSSWVLKDIEDRVMDYQKLLTIFNWSDCTNEEIHEYLKNEELFEESRLCLYFFLNTLELNNIDFEPWEATFSELKSIYESEETVKEDQVQNNSDTDSIKINEKFRVTRNNKRNIDNVNDNQNDEKRQGKRQIKKKFDSQEWVTNSYPRKKKGLECSNSSLTSDNETDRAIYMIKVSANDDDKTVQLEKVSDDLIYSTEKKNSPSKSSTEINIQNASLRLSENADTSEIHNDSSHEFDESEYDIEVNSENKELLSMKTEYCVRGKKHSATLAQWKEGVKCPKCTYMGHSAPRLEQHLAKVHQEDTTYNCKYCEFTCKWNREYYKHMKTHFKGPPYNCEECDYTCDRVQFILSHLMRHTDERPYACDLCTFRSRTKGNLVVHYRIHTGEKPYKCQFCGKKFAMKNTLDQHMATHREDRPYLCDKCGFTTKYQSHLLSHKRIHTGNVFHCDQEACNYFSPRKSQLAAHMRSHLSIRSHVCPTCGRAFIERSHLIRHERIHLDEKPFKCEQCDYGSTRRDKLKEHVFKHHNQNNSEKSFKPRKSRKNESKQYQYIQQVHFENPDQIPEEVQEQIIAHYQNQQMENVSITIGDNVYESQLIVTPVNPNTSKNGTCETTNAPDIQVTNVSDQEIVTDLVEFVLV